VQAKAKRDLGERIRTARTEKGWKQKHLAAGVGVEPITVSRWERAATTPDLDALRLVAEATGKPISYFVDEQPSPTPAAGIPLEDAVGRVEAAASRVADGSARIAAAVEELRDELRRLRPGS
jgi:transcriptional regulator with XRE-family HTH domain